MGHLERPRSTGLGNIQPSEFSFIFSPFVISAPQHPITNIMTYKFKLFLITSSSFPHFVIHGYKAQDSATATIKTSRYQSGIAESIRV